ncbi:MAG TPA: 50S ribosomal protein L32 [Rubricoccaceae bacterium]|nr:50S ribosomal protein L32 [Rubricoccaceae bacterium]
MANPKRKHSHSRTSKRRSQYKVQKLPVTQECPNCGEAKLLHRACPKCGHYRGRAVVEREEAI